MGRPVGLSLIEETLRGEGSKGATGEGELRGERFRFRSAGEELQFGVRHGRRGGSWGSVRNVVALVSPPDLGACPRHCVSPVALGLPVCRLVSRVWATRRAKVEGARVTPGVSRPSTATPFPRRGSRVHGPLRRRTGGDVDDKYRLVPLRFCLSQSKDVSSRPASDPRKLPLGLPLPNPVPSLHPKLQVLTRAPPGS